MKNVALLFLLLISCSCMSQQVQFKSLRYDEDYNMLKSDTSSDWYRQLKFNPVSKDKTVYFSIGGEIRTQYFYFKNQDWGESAADNDGFLLSRYLGHVDFHAGKHFRSFVQLQSSLASGQVEAPSPVDQNILDLHQAFVDYETGNGEKLTFRLGRQELSYGSQRLVSVREAPNNRQSFDAAKVMFASKHIKLDGFYSYYVPAKGNIFDDKFNKSTGFWGAYGAFTKMPLIKNFDFYYFGLHKKAATYDEGKGVETRHSVGARIWDTASYLQYDVEGLFQFGNFAGNGIAAWTFSANLSHNFNNGGKEILVGLKTEAISGDKNRGDGRLNTFNPLFPKGAYFGLAALIGPYNLLDAHPYIQFNLTKKLVLGADYDLFWRMDRNDGLYAVNGRLIYSAKDGNAMEIGRQLGTELQYSPNKYLFFRQEITWFNAGDFLKQTGPGKDILMLGTTVTLKF